MGFFKDLSFTYQLIYIILELYEIPLKGKILKHYKIKHSPLKKA